jgi:hypothetical protein
MMDLLRDMISVRRVGCLASVAAFLLSAGGCGNDDYATAIKRFDDASTVVITVASGVYKGANEIEENIVLDRQLFAHQAVNVTEMESHHLISDDQIKVRLNALDELSKYGASLLALAQAKTTSDVSQQFADLGTALQNVSKDAATLGDPTFSSESGIQFSANVSSVAKAIGTLAQAIEEQKARAELEKIIVANKAPIDALLDSLSAELGEAYARQKAAQGQEWVQLTAVLKEEIGKGADPVLVTLFGDRLKASRSASLTLASADPRPAIKAMRKAHKALADYVASDKSPKNLADLLTASKEFLTRAQVLGDAINALEKSK